MSVRPPGTRLGIAGAFGFAIGLVFFVWALVAQADGRLASQLTHVDLALRYVGLSVAVSLGAGAMAPALRNSRPASVYAGAFGAAYAGVAASLVSSLQWFITLSMMLAGFVVGSLIFRGEVKSAAVFLCADGDDRCD